MDRERELTAAFAAALRAGVTMPEMNPGAEIAALFDAGRAELPAIGRATAARWLARARAALREGTRAELARQLVLSASQYAGLAGLIRSRLNVSVASLLRE